MSLLDKNILQLSRLMESGDITSEELTKVYIKNIEDNGLDTTIYNTLSREKALKKAREVDEKRRTGEKLGPLAGIPMAVTDDISTKDILTTAGSKILENYIPPYNATVIERLWAEDAVILGKLKISEFSLKPLNNEDKAVSSGGAVFALGTGIGGKGTVAVKPSYGAVSRYGFIGATSTFGQIGVTTRNAEDAAFVLNTITGQDKRDSASVDTKKISISNLLTDNIKVFKIAMPEEFFSGHMDKEAKETAVKIREDLEGLGVIVEEISISMARYILPAYHVLSCAEFASNTGRYDGIGFGYRTKEYNDREELYKKTRSEAFGREAKKMIMFGNYVVSGENYERFYKKAQQVRTLIRKETDEVLDKGYNILVPVVESLNDKIKESYRLLANMVGFPAISVPYRLKKNEEPVVLQIVGPLFEEEQLLQMARALSEGNPDKTQEVGING